MENKDKKSKDTDEKSKTNTLLGSLRNLANSEDTDMNIDFKRIKVVNVAQDLSEHQIDKLFRKFGKVEDI